MTTDCFYKIVNALSACVTYRLVPVQLVPFCNWSYKIRQNLFSAIVISLRTCPGFLKRQKLVMFQKRIPPKFLYFSVTKALREWHWRNLKIDLKLVPITFGVYRRYFESIQQYELKSLSVFDYRVTTACLEQKIMTKWTVSHELGQVLQTCSENCTMQPPCISRMVWVYHKKFFLRWTEIYATIRRGKPFF